MSGPFGKIHKKKCCCPKCRHHCCENFNLEDTTLLNTGGGPDQLGCPDAVLCRTVDVLNGWTMDVAGDTEIDEIMGVQVCTGFRTTGTYETNGLIGYFSWEVVVACVGNRTFIQGIRSIHNVSKSIIDSDRGLDRDFSWLGMP